RNWALYGRLDFLHAKGRLAVDLLAIMPKLRTDAQLSLQAAYHPLLLMSAKKRSDVIPLSVELGFEHNVIIITGPNTGGKTVAMKTVGLLALMTQSGLLIPADEKSQVGIFSKVFADIGDEQSIELSLSTYSSHIARVTYALKHCDRYSLLLFDELGVGTDPKEGSALAEAVIEFVAVSGAKCIVTTHYSALKAIAETNKKVENASMEFNRETFQPTYKFRTGLPGSSYALEVASRLGMPPEILARAGELVGTQERSLADLISRLEAELMATDAAREQLRVKLQRAEEEDIARKSQQSEIDKKEKQLLREGLEEANKLVEETRRKMEALMVEMREPQATKGDVKRARKTIEEFRSELAERADALVPKQPAGAPPVEGDKVFIERLRTDGELLEIFPDGKRGKVRIGRIVYTMDLADLRKIGENEAKPEIPQGVNYQPYKDDVQMEISLRGLTVEEARDVLDKYFDEIALTHLPSVRIVHGKGTGALRRMVREYLAKNKMVES
ncbi:MAG: Smr/MutS family protein, partial [Candidatus Zixiibacteriota bacterium]